MSLLFLALLSSSNGNTDTIHQEVQQHQQQEPDFDEVVDSNQLQQLLESMAALATKSPVTMTLLCTILSLFLCLGVANTFFQSQAEAFRVGLHRRVVVRPAISPFRRLLPQDDRDGADRNSSMEDKRERAQSDYSATNSTLQSLASFDVNFLNDLAPPFLAAGAEGHDLTAHLESPDVTHFCFLLHGHRGLSKDLTYMQVMMQRIAVAEKQKRGNADETYTTKKEEPSSAAIHDMVVHNSVCNEGKTTDGVRNGGDRLVEEMRQVIEDEMIKRHPELEYLKADREEDGEDVSLLTADKNSSAQENSSTPLPMYDVTMSIVGNSLGGLFGRYAIAKLIDRHCVLEPESDCWILDGRFRLHLNVFCTTATPHLGVSRHTYVKIPRTAEIGVAHAMGNTGKDLFRLNDLLHSMATTPAFLKPLAKFRKRIAYANAYGTDFPVPASTAAFLSENSTYPHHIVETNTTSTGTSMSEDRDSLNITETHGGMVIATLRTLTQPHGDSDSEEEEEDHGDVDNRSNSSSPSVGSQKYGDQEDELEHMSRSLDRLGWKKVFVDIRRELPSAELPKSSWLRRFNSDPSSLDETPAQVPNLQSLQMENRVVQSREVATAVASATDNRVALPLGHNMIVAFSRSRLTTFINKGGRPVVDSLAKELVEEIFTWDETELASDLSQIPSNSKRGNTSTHR
jgi:hypothetical protein